MGHRHQPRGNQSSSIHHQRRHLDIGLIFRQRLPLHRLPLYVRSCTEPPSPTLPSQVLQDRCALLLCHGHRFHLALDILVLFVGLI